MGTTSFSTSPVSSASQTNLDLRRRPPPCPKPQTTNGIEFKKLLQEALNATKKK